MTGWRWWLGGQWKVEALVGVIGLAGIVFHAAGVGPLGPESVYMVFFFWMALAVGLEFEPDGGWSTRMRPDPPTGRVALAGPTILLAASVYPLRIFDFFVLAQRELDSFEWTLLWFLGLCSLVLLPVAAATGARPANWLLRYNRERSERAIEAERTLALARVQMLQAQMQPHFLYNALNTASALLRDEPQRGREVLLRLKSLVERTWTSVEMPMTTVEQELAFIRDQLSIEQARFCDRLTVSRDVDAAVMGRQIPALSLQPLVENALKHGIARSLDGGHIHIRVHTDGDDLVATVADSSNTLEPGWSMGTGLSNLRDRLAALYGAAASLTLASDDNWTVATLRVPGLRQPATTA